MSFNVCHDFLLKRIHHPGTVVLNEPGKTYTCGRGKENHIHCVSFTVSRQHCSFFRNDDEIYVIDLGSFNGLFINEIRQKAWHMIKLKDNDIIGIGCQNAKDKDIRMFIYKLCCIIKNKTPKDRMYTAMGKQLSRKDLSTGSTDTYCHSRTVHNSNESSDLVLSNEMSELSKKNIDKTHPIKMFKEKSNAEVCKIISNEVVNLTIKYVESSTMRQNELHFKFKHNDKCLKKNDTNKRKKSSEINNEESSLIQPGPSSKTNELQQEKEIETICIDSSNDTDTEMVQQKENNKTKNTCADERRSELSKKNIDTHKNLIYNGTYYIKMEDELIINDDEQIIINSIDELGQLKEEPRLRFSEIDIVNLSDDEENLFPSSQLFNSNLDVNSIVKKKIKQEYNANHDEDVNRADDTEIIISDSEDEFNIWLHKLSQSQMHNDTTLSNNNIVNTKKN